MIVLIGDFHEDSLKHPIDNTNNENVLSACKYKKQNKEPKRKTAISSTWSSKNKLSSWT